MPVKRPGARRWMMPIPPGTVRSVFTPFCTLNPGIASPFRHQFSPDARSRHATIHERVASRFSPAGASPELEPGSLVAMG